jgi:hypothetical protein
MERAGVMFSRSVLTRLQTETVVQFVNHFHSAPGFHHLVKDLVVSKGKRDGALFVMRYALAKVDPKLAKFELGVGITRGARGTEFVARKVDIVVSADRTLRHGDAISYELKSWTRETLAKFAEPAVKGKEAPIFQLVKDTAIHERTHTRWVLDSAKISKDEVKTIFKRAIAQDSYLSAKWPTGDALDIALEQLIETFP